MVSQHRGNKEELKQLTGFPRNDVGHFRGVAFAVLARCSEIIEIRSIIASSGSNSGLSLFMIEGRQWFQAASFATS